MSLRHLKEYDNCETTLKHVFEDLLDEWPIDEIYITCIYRSSNEDEALSASGVHASMPHRAIDVRIKTLPGNYQRTADELADYINMIWVYDPTRPHIRVAVAKLHGSGPHIHLQVHYQTVRRIS